MGNSPSNLSLSEIEDIVVPTTKEPLRFADPAVTKSNTHKGSGHYFDHHESLLLEQLYRTVEDPRAKDVLRKYVHREVFTLKDSRKVPKTMHIDENYLHARDVNPKQYPDGVTIRRENELDDETMRAFGISIADPESPYSSRHSVDFSSGGSAMSDDDNCYTPPTSTNNTPSHSPVSKGAKLERTLNVRKRQSKASLQGEHCLEKQQSSSTLRSEVGEVKRQPARKRTKSMDFGTGIKRISSLFKSPAPPVPDLAPDTDTDADSAAAHPFAGEFKHTVRINDQPPKLELTNFSNEQLNIPELCYSGDESPSSPTSPNKEFDFLLDKRSLPPKPSRIHSNDNNDNNDESWRQSLPVNSETFRQYKGKYGSPRVASEKIFGEAGEKDVTPQPTLHWRQSYDATINAGIPPRVPPHRLVSSSSVSKKLLKSNLSNGHHAGSAASQGMMIDDSQCGSTEKPIPTWRPGHKVANSEDSTATTSTTASINPNIYTRKCSFQKRRQTISQPPVEQAPEEPEELDSTVQKHEFVLPGYDQKNRLMVVNRSTDKLSIDTSRSVTPLQETQQKRDLQRKRRMGRKFFSCYDQLNVDQEPIDFVNKATDWKDSSETSSIIGAPFTQTTSDFCQYFGLDMLSGNPRASLRSDELWNDRGQRFLSSGRK